MSHDHCCFVRFSATPSRRLQVGDSKPMLSRRSQDAVALCNAKALHADAHPAPPTFPDSWPRAVVCPSVLQKVRAGEAIALSGNTGFTAGPHLHFDAVDILPQESECWIMERVHGNLPVSSPTTVRCRAAILRSQGLGPRVCRASIDSESTEWNLKLFGVRGGGRGEDEISKPPIPTSCPCSSQV